MKIGRGSWKKLISWYPGKTGHSKNSGVPGNSRFLCFPGKNTFEKIGGARNISPPNTYNALIDARLLFMEIDFGMNGIRFFFVRKADGSLGPEAAFLNLSSKRN